MNDKEYGGCLPLELNLQKEYYEEKNCSEYKILKLNCARSALLYLMEAKQIKEIYIPHYICKTVIDALVSRNIKIYYYYLDDDFLPKSLQLDDNQYLLWVNYFGINSFKIKILEKKYKNLIVDSTQAFFSKPIGNVDFIYSCRKFFGVPDGAYLIGKEINNINLNNDSSYKKIEFLAKNIEYGSNESYSLYLENEDIFASNRILKMSILTEMLLKTVNYENIKNKRTKNFQYLHSKLKDINELKNLELFSDDVPLIYPLLISNNDLRQYLLDNKIYISCWWKYLLEKMPEKSLEYKFSKFLLPLPIDQRYNEEDMDKVAMTILKYENL